MVGEEVLLDTEEDFEKSRGWVWQMLFDWVWQMLFCLEDISLSPSLQLKNTLILTNYIQHMGQNGDIRSSGFP